MTQSVSRWWSDFNDVACTRRWTEEVEFTIKGDAYENIDYETQPRRPRGSRGAPGDHARSSRSGRVDRMVWSLCIPGHRPAQSIRPFDRLRARTVSRQLRPCPRLLSGGSFSDTQCCSGQPPRQDTGNSYEDAYARTAVWGVPRVCPFCDCAFHVPIIARIETTRKVKVCFVGWPQRRKNNLRPHWSRSSSMALPVSG